jgi:hypothetical protein
MEKLPQELINRIVWFAERYPGQEERRPAMGQSFERNGPPSQFPRLAILNRTWKEAVETITFRHLGVQSSELETLQSITTGNRRKYLAWISFTAELPTYSEEAYAHKESRLEQHANNEAFTKSIGDLFAILRTWEDDGVRNAVRLDIMPASSPTDWRAVDEIQIAIRDCRDISTARWAELHLRLIQPDILPTLSNVQHLAIESGGRLFAPCLAPELVLLLPELRTVDWEFQDWDDDESDRDSLTSDYDPEWESATSPKARGEALGDASSLAQLCQNHLLPLHSFRSEAYRSEHCPRRPHIRPVQFRNSNLLTMSYDSYFECACRPHAILAIRRKCHSSVLATLEVPRSYVRHGRPIW